MEQSGICYVGFTKVGATSHTDCEIFGASRESLHASIRVVPFHAETLTLTLFSFWSDTVTDGFLVAVWSHAI